MLKTESLCLLDEVTEKFDMDELERELAELDLFDTAQQPMKKDCCNHEDCGEDAVMHRMDRDSELWHYCKKCGDWTRKYNNGM